MTLSGESQARSVRLYHAEHWRIGTMVSPPGVHHWSVRRVLNHAGTPLPEPAPRRTIVDPFVVFIVDTLERFARLSTTRLCDDVIAPRPMLR